MNSFYYFLANKSFNLSKLTISTTNIAMSLILDKLKNSATIYLIVDDTLQKKHGDKFKCYGKLFGLTRKNRSSYLNGHCFVSLVLAIPVIYNETIHYIKIPIEYKLYDKSKTKLELAIDMITISASSLESYQVVVLCDSWHIKNPLLKALTKLKNVAVIGALRSDTVLFDLAPKSTDKIGRPRKKEDRLNYRNFKYEKEDNYFTATVKVLTNLLEDAVYITVTTTDIEKYINLIGVTYTLTSLLPFMSNKFSKYKFQDPQKIKYRLSESISKELIYSNLLKTLQINKNIINLEDVIK